MFYTRVVEMHSNKKLRVLIWKWAFASVALCDLQQGFHFYVCDFFHPNDNDREVFFSSRWIDEQKFPIDPLPLG